MSEFKQWLIKRFKIERKRFDRLGVYAYTQRAMAYNSNKIEGSTLTPEQTASLFTHFFAFLLYLSRFGDVF